MKIKRMIVKIVKHVSRTFSGVVMGSVGSVHFNMQSSFCEQSVGCTFRVTCLEMIEEIIMN